MTILQRMPRLMVGAIAAICAASVVLIVIGLTGRIVDAEGDVQATPRPQPSAEAPRETEAPRAGGGILYTPGRAIADEDDGDTNVTIETEDRPTPTQTTRPPTPRPTTPQPSPSDRNDVAETVEDTVDEATKTAEDVAKQLNDVGASAIAGVP